ncbi:MAG: 4-hydroxy-3-methylbut-2-enyl diphosphate reductase [Chloroflexi bacterium RBG_13_50_10]|nr:MAG: 4-hydroxy-3-methylbut-2-enyl diphosphate reductase [Chloroflexi bacterium RBG_13_50_10]
MAKVDVKKAREFGLCFGVRRAIKIIDTAAREYQEITTLGPIVHNRLVVAKLADAGVKVVNELDQVHDSVIAVTSHGVSPQLLLQMQARKLQVIDTTCPIVSSAQKAAKKLAQAGLRVIIFGEATHPEVKGLLGWAGSDAVATLSGAEIANLELPPRLGIISQTTQSHTKFVEFINEVTRAVFPDVLELRIINTLCRETQKRQEAAVELAGESDLMIVVGGHNSANTQRLAEICSPIVETHLIETAAEIKKDWLLKKHHIGVTAGASTPDEAIEEVVLKLKSLAGGD